MKVRILSLAIEDLDRGHAFYDKLQPGLGEYFLDTCRQNPDRTERALTDP